MTAQTFTTRSFDGANGYAPTAGLILGTDGNLYGTTGYGGDTSCETNSSYVGCGTIFRVTPSGKLTTLYNFCRQSGCPDGEFPFGGLIQATDGNFYGTTFLGGAYGAGTVFKITPSGLLTTLHSFAGYPVDGANPGDALIQATDGNFYGTTLYGGPHQESCYSPGCGTVFKITRSGTLTILHNFDYGDGSIPLTPLIEASNRNFYGTTSLGGANDRGAIFEITPKGILNTVYSFCSQSNCTDGYTPAGALLQAADGNLYGTTEAGGSYGDYGTVFRITSSGKLTTLHSFALSDGMFPVAGLVQARNGNFYGTTIYGGAYSGGVVFEITSNGKLTLLHSFTGPDGAYPGSNLVEDTNSGKLYGTTESGGTLSGNYLCEFSGSGGCGTIFSLF